MSRPTFLLPLALGVVLCLGVRAHAFEPIESGVRLEVRPVITKGEKIELLVTITPRLVKPEADSGSPRIHVRQLAIAVRPLIQKVAKSGKPLLVIAEDIEGEALATVVMRRLRAVFGQSAQQGADKRSLLIFVTPTIIVNEDQSNQSKDPPLPPRPRLILALALRKILSLIGQ